MRVRFSLRLRIVTTALIGVVTALGFGPHLCADDRPSSADEAAVLDRIFANWKARHDRVQTLHMTWDSRRTWNSHPRFSGETLPTHRVDKGEAYDQFGVQVFLDGDQRYCKIEPVLFKAAREKPTDARQLAERWVIDGDTTWKYVAGPRTLWAREREKPHGIVARAMSPDPRLEAMQAPWLTFRPEFPNLSWRRDQSRLVDENATIDGVPCVKIERVVVPRPPANGPRPPNRVESLWVSPAREDVVVHWASEARRAVLAQGTIRYNTDPKFGWIPSEWTNEIPRIHNIEECRVTGYTINKPIDPSVFSHEFPPGTPAQDQRALGKAEGLRHYVVEANGSRRAISQEDFVRLSSAGPVPEKKPPALKEPRTK